MHHDEQSFPQLIVNEEWGTIARALLSLDTGVEENGTSTKRLHKKAEMVKKVFWEYMNDGYFRKNSIDASLFVGTAKMINSLEKEYEKNRIKRREFLVFLKLILYKFRQQKITAKKQLEIRSEFHRMKRVVEDEDKTLRQPHENRDG